MGTISKNFSYKEFEESETAERKGIANVINTTEIRDSVKALVLNVLQPLRDAWGKSLHINSGYRCPQLNKAVGGAPKSYHLLGRAADITTNGCNRRLYNILQSLPHTELIWENDGAWIHVAL